MAKTNKNLKVAKEMLEQSFGYVGGANSGLHFNIELEKEELRVYSSFGSTFFWVDRMVDVARACRLDMFAYLDEIDGVSKVVFKFF